MASLPCATRQVENFDEQEYGDFLVTHEKLLEEFTHATWEQSRELMRVRGKCVQVPSERSTAQVAAHAARAAAHRRRGR